MTTMSRLMGDLMGEAGNKYDLVLRVAQLAKQIKEETRGTKQTTNPVIQALQEIAAQRDGTLLVDSR